MRPVENGPPKARDRPIENRRRLQLIGGIKVRRGGCRHGGGLDHDADLRGPAMAAEGPAVLDRDTTLGTGMLHGVLRYSNGLGRTQLELEFVSPG